LNQTIYNQELLLSATIIGLKQNLTVKNSKEVVKNNFTTNKQAKHTLNNDWGKHLTLRNFIKQVGCT